MAKLPPIPVGVAPGHSFWNDWYEKLRNLINNNLLNHNDLQNIQGGSAAERYHLTSAQATTVSTIDYGTYTPTLTNVLNITASTAYVCQYLRVGPIVHVSGKVDIDPTAAAAITRLGMTLPIASNFANSEQLAGTANSISIVSECAGIFGDTTNDRAQFNWITTTGTNNSYYFTFTYQVL